MAVIREDDFIQSVADALQYISYYHPADYIQHLYNNKNDGERRTYVAMKDALEDPARLLLEV